MVTPSINPVTHASTSVIKDKIIKHKAMLNKIQHILFIIVHANPPISLNDS